MNNPFENEGRFMSLLFSSRNGLAEMRVVHRIYQITKYFSHISQLHNLTIDKTTLC